MGTPQRELDPRGGYPPFSWPPPQGGGYTPIPYKDPRIELLGGAPGQPRPGPMPSPFGPGGFFGQGQQFLQGLFSGQLPESMRESFAETQARAQNMLNQQLQQRGGFFATPGLQMQADLARRGAQDVSNLLFDRAMQAIPQGMGLFGGAAGLAEIPSGLPPWFQGAMGLLGGLRGQVTQPQFQEDPFLQILKGLLPFLF